MSYQQELLDGHREMVAEFGASITLDGQSAPIGVVLVFPEASQDLLAAGVLQKAQVHFEIERTLSTAAGIVQETLLRVTGEAQLLHVTGIESDPGVPIIYVTAEEDQ